MKKTVLVLGMLFMLVLTIYGVAYAEGDTDAQTDYSVTPSVSSLSINSYPHKTVYGAFERLDTSGLSLRAVFTDGTERIITGQEIRVSYNRDSCFRVGDDSVMLSYGGRSVYLPVTVNRVAYDLSTLALSGFSTTYNGAFQSYDKPFTQIVGLDGIPIVVNTSGGGINVGVYDISIDFYTDSLDYLLPESRVINMTIEPAPAEIVWEGTSFVYDGKSKSPTAYYIDVSGNRVYPAVSGAATNAGSGYIARVTVNDLNYEFSNTSTSYEIRKADYDFSSVVWSNDSFTYDGTKKSISASGFPYGVSVVGYTGDRGSEAGAYKAIAMLKWDELNYNTPPVITHSWEIKKADYNMSGVSFINKSYVYDGSVHYPTLVGSMPVGADGIRLEYSFSAGASHVADGVVSVIISFTTASNNYNLPPEQYASVSITPLGINIAWGESSLTYNGEEQTPTAHSDACIVEVSGGATSVGKYCAVATTSNQDYYIINDRLEYNILRADNFWSTLPADSVCYEGREIKLTGKSRFGKVEIRYFLDAECKQEINAPTERGVYYAILSVPETADYTGLVSPVISFEIVEVVAVSFLAGIVKEDIRAFDRLGPSDFVCSVLNNDGSITVIDSSLVTVIYESKDSFRKSDREVKLQYKKFSLTLPVEVGYADYDLSGVIWASLSQIYTGKAMTPILKGLPDGVCVLGYSGGEMINSGSYTVYAELDYDRENYNEPQIPPCEFVIEKCPLPLPLITVTYNGELQIPMSLSSYYTVDSDTGYKAVGSYPVAVSLADTSNYVFKDNGSDEGYAIFRILPATISVEVLDVNLRLFEELSHAEYRVVSGEVYEGDIITVTAYMDGNQVLIRSNNPNYDFEVTPGQINRLPYPTLEGGIIIFFCTFVLALLIALCFLAYKNRHRLASATAMLRCRWHNRAYKAMPPREIVKSDLKYDLKSFGATDTVDTEENIPDPEEVTAFEETEDEVEKTDVEDDDPVLEIDAEKADELISDSLAKTLIKREGEMVYTSGSERAIVNIDILAKNFAPNEKIDVNVLKSCGILQPEIAYYKVLAGGRIDKPLKIYANDFSLTAVKMIALTGGEAIKVVTFKDKSGEKG